jgi:hypothetical protein
MNEEFDIDIPEEHEDCDLNYYINASNATS